MKRSSWSTRLGFYLAAVGSAFGLGSLWRFPYIVAENGGGAFVLLYAALVFILGVPLLIAELTLGKAMRRSLVAAVRLVNRGGPLPGLEPQTPSAACRWRRHFWTATALLSVPVCLFVLSYYAVVSGWVLYFFSAFLGAAAGAFEFQAASLNAVLDAMGGLQVILAGLHIALAGVIVAKDVDQGMERWVGYMIPGFVILLIPLMVKSLSLDTQFAGLRFLLYPDFSRLRLGSFPDAVGHVCFALSIGFGTMVTFGSYLKSRSYIPLAGFRVATVDSFVSLFACLLIFPLVFFLAPQAHGPGLLFQTVPRFFSEMGGGYWYGMAFFLCLYLAALAATIGILETVVANFMDRYRMRRQRAAFMAAVLCWVVSLLPALSSSVFRDVTLDGRGVLEIIDRLLINWVLPLLALGTSLLVSFRLSDRVTREEFIAADSPASEKLYGHWLWALRWLVPLIIGGSLLVQIIQLVFGLA